MVLGKKDNGGRARCNHRGQDFDFNNKRFRVGNIFVVVKSLKICQNKEALSLQHASLQGNTQNKAQIIGKGLWPDLLENFVQQILSISGIGHLSRALWKGWCEGRVLQGDTVFILPMAS